MASESITSEEYRQARSSKFKFKSKRASKHSHELNDEGDDTQRSKRRRHGHESSSRRSSRHKESKPKYHEPLNDDPATYDDTYENNGHSENFLSTDAAFRESLFDALADDEGASFWEGVYGQPIHVYSNTKPGTDGELEQMDDDEYAEYVRSRMWEKTHQHIMEEREKREEQRRRRKEQEEQGRREEEAWKERLDKDRSEREDLNAKISHSLYHSEQRKAQKRWQEAWNRYLLSWDRFKEVLETKSKEEGSLTGKAARGVIPWPVESGRWKYVEKEDIEEFFQKAVPAGTDMLGVLKSERVRWHPDKMQQRFGANKLDEQTVKTITAVFQSIDRMWNQLREKK